MIGKCGTNAETLVAVLKDRASKNDQESIFYVDMILALVEYTNFIEMMYDYHKQKLAGHI